MIIVYKTHEWFKLISNRIYINMTYDNPEKILSLRSLIPQKSEVFSSIMIGSERGFSDFPEVLWSISFSVLEDT